MLRADVQCTRWPAAFLAVDSCWDVIGRCVGVGDCWDETLGCRWKRVLGCDVKWTRGPVGHSLGACSVDGMQVKVARIMDGEDGLSSTLWSHGTLNEMNGSSWGVGS